ncbi:MAG: tyrosine-protein phosphatase [Acidimicrobiales bacterium]
MRPADPAAGPPPEPGALIALDGAMNLRDLGGWTGLDGRTVARGQAYRCDRLSELTDADLAVLAGLGIETVIDLRHEGETAEHPSRLWASVVLHRNIPMAGELAVQKSLVDLILDGEITEVTVAEVEASYREMLTRHAPGFGLAVETLLTSEGPTLFHCTAGKDRTGLLAMLVLSTLGVADDDVIRDFGLSNRYRAERRIAQLRPSFEARGLDIECFRPALSAPEPALAAAIPWLRQSHGSVEAYLEGPAGVSDAGRRLRERLLYP